MKQEKTRLVILLYFCCLPLFSEAGFVVLGSMNYKYIAQKGETYTAIVKIHNTGAKDQEVKMYLRDYLYNYEGDSFYNDPGTNKRSNANWIQYSPKTLLLKGNETQNAQFQVTVPVSDTLVGTYWSILMVEGVNSPDPNSKSQFTIRESIRYAIQIVTNIGKTGTGELKFQNPGIVREGGKPYFDFIMVNTGERLISPDVSMELFDMTTGVSVKMLKAAKNGMYPTTSTKWRFPLEGLPTRKTYKAVIIADGSGEDVFGLEYTIVL
ncbi:MAG: hypothetical protein WCJ95_03395 [Mariniphaga sp.]